MAYLLISPPPGHSGRNTTICTRGREMPRGKKAQLIDIKDIIEKHRGSISVCMIARDEEGVIGEALGSVKDLADEMIVVDTGSRDGTIPEAKRCGARVFEIRWNNDFSEARNFALSKATKEWILVLDADEALGRVDHEKIRSIVGGEPDAAFSFEQRTYTNAGSGPGLKALAGPDDMAMGSAGYSSDRQVRLFRNKGCIRYACEIHENVEESLMEADIPICESDVVVHHYGRIRDDGRIFRKALVWSALGREGMEAYPAAPMCLYEMAAQFLAIGKPRDAALHAEMGLEIAAGSWELWNVAGLAHLRNGERNEALSFFRGGITVEPRAPELCNNMGVALLESGEPAEALLYFERGIDLESDNPNVLRNAAAACALVGELERGLGYIRRSLALEAFAPHSHTIHADILYRMNDFSGACAVLESMRFIRETPLKIYLKVIQLYTKMHFTEEADRVVRAAIEEYPEREDFLYLAGKIAELRGDDERAVSLYQRVLAIAAGHADALNSLGCIYERRDRLDDALAAFREALRLKPREAQLEVNVGIILDKLGRTDEAERHFAVAMERGEDTAFAYNALGCHLAKSNRFEEALAYFSKAVELETGNATYHRNLGLACEKMNLYDRAVQVYERMAAIDPQAASLARERLSRLRSPIERV